MQRPVEAFKLELPYKRTLGPVIGAFFTALRDGRLVGSRTPRGRVLCPPLEYDPETGEGVSEIVDLSDTGTVQSWSWVPQPLRRHPLSRPFAFALIRIDGADTALLHAVDAGSPKAMSAGMRVKARFAAERKGHIRDLECFVPLK
jgi:uncharacterized OB-fold protein